MSLARNLERSLRTLERALDGPQFLYRGRYLPCVPNTLSRGDKLVIGGFDAEVTLTIYVRKSQVDTLAVDDTVQTGDADALVADNDKLQPHPGKKADYRYRTYRILRVSEDPAGVFWKVDLTDPH